MQSKKPDIDNLISEIKKGNKQAVNYLFKLHYPALCYYAENLVQNKQDARDIVNDTFVKLLRKLNDFDSVEKIKSFLFTTTRNASVDYLRSKQRQIAHTAEIRYLFDEGEDNTDFELTRAKVMHQIYEEIENLPPQRKEISN